MKTVLQPDKNSSKLIEITTPLPVPSHPGDVLVKVHATCPCKGELWWARDFPSVIPEDKELVPGQDFSGTVVSAPASSQFKLGDEVYARIHASRPGCLREYTLARTSELALKPHSLNFLEASATPLSALTAWQALFVQGTLDPAALKGNSEAKERNGQIRVLITGAAGGVGSWAVQFASLAGAAAVAAVCGLGKEDTIRQLGATDIIDYSAISIADWAHVDPAARECHLIVDCVGGSTLTGCWGAVQEGGAIISISGIPDMMKPQGLAKRPAKSLFFIVESLGENLAQISELVDAGKTRPTIDSVWEFQDFQKAFNLVEGGHTNGKVVIKVDGLV